MLGIALGKKSGLNVLCIAAHGDDIEIGCGGTLLKIQEEYNIEFVRWVVFSSDETRKNEIQQSAGLFLKNFKNKELVIRSYRDSYLPFSAKEIKEDFETLKANPDPDIVFTHYRNDLHQDHRLLNDFTWNTFRNHTILEYEIPKYDADIGNPNLYVPLKEKTAELKIKYLLKAYRSQSEKHWFDEETFKSLMRLRGLESASKYAEAFYARKLSLNKHL